MAWLPAVYRRIGPVEARIAGRSHRPSASPDVTPDLFRGPDCQAPLQSIFRPGMIAAGCRPRGPPLPNPLPAGERGLLSPPPYLLPSRLREGPGEGGGPVRSEHAVARLPLELRYALHRHGRTCSGHPRRAAAAHPPGSHRCRETWMAGTSPAMTAGGDDGGTGSTIGRRRTLRARRNPSLDRADASIARCCFKALPPVHASRTGQQWNESGHDEEGSAMTRRVQP